MTLSTDREAHAHNSGFKKLAVQWLNQFQFSNQTFVLVENFMLRNRQLRKPENRYKQGGLTSSKDNLSVDKNISVLNKLADFATLRRPLDPSTRSLNFYSTALFGKARFGYPTLQHFCKPAQATARPKARKKAAIPHPPYNMIIFNILAFNS